MRGFRVRSIVVTALAALLLLASLPVDAAPGPSMAHAAGVSPELAEKLRHAQPAEELQLIVRLHAFADEGDAADLRAMGLALTRALHTVPIYGATGTAAAATTAMKDPRVAYLELDLPLHYTLASATRQARARDVWDALPGAAPVVIGGQVVDGTGVGVAVVDSGIDATHPDLAWGSRVQRNHFRTVAFANTFVTPPLVPDAVNFVDTPHSDLTSGHGTHVAGIVGGSGAASGGLHQGAAPGATIYGYGMGQGINILAANEAFDHILRNFDSFDPPIKVVTNSYGSCGDRWNANSATSILVGKLLQRDVNVIWAAGNIDSTCTDVHGGGAADDPRPGVIGVGNYDGSGGIGRDGTINPSSSQGFADQPPSMWPDVAAPGTDIVSASASTGALSLASGGTPAGYVSFTGTSMATPLVAGVVALVRQADPTLTAAQVEQVLRRTAYRYDDDIDQSVGHVKKGVGLVDAFAAVHAVTQGLGADAGVQAMSVTSGSLTTPIRRTAAETATGNVTIGGDVLFLGAPAPTYRSNVLAFHGTPVGGFNPTLGLAPYTFAAGENLSVQARGVTSVGGAPDPLNATARVVARHLDTGALLFDRTCVFTRFVDNVLGVDERRCGTAFVLPVTTPTGVYEIVFTTSIGASTVEFGVQNVMILGASAPGATLVDPGARAPVAPAPLPAGAPTVRARFGTGAWTPASVTGSAWSVDLTVPTGGGVLEVEATDGTATARDRVVFGAPAPAYDLQIAGPASAPFGQPVTFTASVAQGGTWSFEWDAAYDGATFTADGAGASFTTTYAAAGAYTVAVRATSGATTLLQTRAHTAVGPVAETVLLDTTFEQDVAVPFALVGTLAASEGLFIPDPQATTFEIVLPAGVDRLIVEVTWGFYDTLADNGFLTANDIDIWIEDPAGLYDHHGGATAAHGERAVIDAPMEGKYLIDVTPFFVVEPDTVRVVVKTVG